MIEGRPVGSPPHTLLDYFPRDSTGRTSTLGSSSPVGRITCSTICPDRSRSYSPGVAETYTTW